MKAKFIIIGIILRWTWACFAQSFESVDPASSSSSEVVEGISSPIRINFTPATLLEPISCEIKSVTHHSGAFVAVGGHLKFSLGGTQPTGPGIVLISPDGVTWRTTYTNELGLYAVISVAGKLVATADAGALLTSSNGETWELRRSNTTNALRAITYGNGIWLAVGDRGATARSNDGLNWVSGAIDDPLSSRYVLTGIAFGRGLFVAVGGDHLGFTFSSRDGVTWSKTRLPGLSVAPTGIAYGKGRFISVGGTSRVAISVDGLEWSEGGNLRIQRADSVSYGQGRFLVVAQSGVVSSRDGTKWVRDFSRELEGGVEDVAYHDGKYVSVGLQGLLLHADGSLPVLDSVTARGGTAILFFSGGTEARYAVHAATSLNAPIWTRIGEAFAADGVGTFEDKSAGEFLQRYYRLTLP